MRLKGMRRNWRSGAAAVEFALMMPLIAFVIFATADYGNALQQAIRLEFAARAGAQVALTAPGDAAGIRAAVMANLGGLSLSNGTGCGGTNQSTGDVCVTTQRWCQCNPGTTAAITPTAAVACDTEDSNTPPCGTTPVAGFVSISVERPYSRFFLIPPRTLRGNVELRYL